MKNPNTTLKYISKLSYERLVKMRADVEKLAGKNDDVILSEDGSYLPSKEFLKFLDTCIAKFKLAEVVDINSKTPIEQPATQATTDPNSDDFPVPEPPRKPSLIADFWNWLSWEWYEKKKPIFVSLVGLTLAALIIFWPAKVIYNNFSSKLITHGYLLGFNDANNKHIEYTRLLDKAYLEENPVQLAYLFEEISKKIETDKTSTLYLARAVTAEKLLLHDRSQEDLTSYNQLTGKNRESVVKQKIYEPDIYEQLETSINSYLMARSSGAENLAITHLNKAKTFAKDIEKTGDKIGIDLVRFYSDLPSNRVHKLLKLRQKKDQLANVPAIDNFQENISQLEILKKSFESEGAKEDTESVAFLLAKFLMKTNSKGQREAFELLSRYTSVCQIKSHKLNEAKFTFLKGEIAIYKGNQQQAAEYHNRSLQMLEMISPNLFKLYPIHIIISKQVGLGGSETNFIYAYDAIKLSASSQHKLYKTLASTTALFHALNTKNLNMPHLAREYLLFSIKLAKEHNAYGYARESTCLLAVLEAKEGNTNEAFRLIKEAENYKSEDLTSKIMDEALIFGYKAKLLGLIGNYGNSEELYRKTLALLNAIGANHILYTGQVEQGLGEALLMQGKDDEATVFLTKASQKLTEHSSLQAFQKLDSYQKLNFTEKTPEQLLSSINR